MDKYKIIDSDIIYDKFVEHYSSNKYKIDKRLIKKDNIYATAFCKLFFIYGAICLAIFIVFILYPNEIFGGMTVYKMLRIFGRILLFFVFLFILSIFEFTTKKDEYSATFSLWEVLNKEKILESEKRLEIIGLLYENKDKVGSFYIKLFNIIKNSEIVKYSKWLTTLFIGFYTGIIASIITKYIEKDVKKNILDYISILGRGLGTILIIFLIFGILYYFCIYIIYKDHKKKHDLYVLALKNVKYILLRENTKTKDEIRNLIKNSKENCIMENETNESKNKNDKGAKDTKFQNNTEELTNDIARNSEEKQSSHRKNLNRYLYLLLILSIIFLSVSVAYVIIYFNINSKTIKEPILILVFYIVLIFINITYRILNNGLDLNFKDISCLSKNFLTNTGINYSIILCIITLVSKLLIFTNNKTTDITKLICDYFNNSIQESLFILIILLIIGNTIKQIRIFLEDHNILEKI